MDAGDFGLGLVAGIVLSGLRLTSGGGLTIDGIALGAGSRATGYFDPAPPFFTTGVPKPSALFSQFSLAPSASAALPALDTTVEVWLAVLVWEAAGSGVIQHASALVVDTSTGNLYAPSANWPGDGTAGITLAYGVGGWTVTMGSTPPTGWIVVLFPTDCGSAELLGPYQQQNVTLVHPLGVASTWAPTSDQVNAGIIGYPTRTGTIINVNIPGSGVADNAQFFVQVGPGGSDMITLVAPAGKTVHGGATFMLPGGAPGFYAVKNVVPGSNWTVTEVTTV